MLANYLAFVDEECIDQEQHIIATFEVMVEDDWMLEDAALMIACDPTIGTWTSVGVENQALLRDYSGKVILPLPRGSAKRGRVRIAIPLTVIDPAIGGVSHLMAILGSPFGLQRLKIIRLDNIDFPTPFIASHPGPRFGLEAIYERLGYQPGRPLLSTMLKPRSGLDAQSYQQQAFKALSGGIDIIFDDELMVSPKSAPLEERVPRVKEAVLKAAQRTGDRKLYAVNITSSVHHIVDTALRVKSLGADMLYINPLVTGLSVLELLATNDEIDLPILACRSMHGVFHRGENGIDMYVLLKLARLCGADGMHIGSISGKLPHRVVGDVGQVRARARVSTSPTRTLKKMIPILSGGMHPGNIEWNIKQVGPNVIVQAGSGVLGHPSGPEAGGRAMRAVVNGLVSNKSTLETSKRSKDLQQALEKWGYLDEGAVQDVR